MKLMTQILKRAFARVGDQEDAPDPLVIAKFFTPTGAVTWWATEYDPEDRLFFGYITGLGCDEWVYFSLDELESVTLPLGLKIAGDIFAKGTGKSPVKSNLGPRS